jgi:glycosyltransferase involved in cell wall biosynthesis
MHTAARKPAYLFVVPWSLHYAGGVNQVVINLARQAIAAGEYEPIVLITDWNATRPIWEDFHGLKTVRWRIRPHHPGMGVKEGLAYFLWESRFRRTYEDFCRQHQVAVINVHYPNSSVFAIDRVIATFEQTIPLIVSFHGADLTALRSAEPPSVIERWRRLLGHVRGVVVCSHDLGNTLVGIMGNEVSPEVIHNGLDSGDFVAMATEPAPTGQRIILNVAKFEEKKGQDVLVEAFAAIADDYADLTLVLVGATDKALPSLRALCAERGIDKRVQFVPDAAHRQVADFLRRATVFCLPSRQEPFGIVLLEAASFGVPVVASRVGGIPEIISHGINGQLVAPDDPVELALCLRAVLDDPVAAKQMGRSLSQHVGSRFTWAAAYRKYTNLIRRQDLASPPHMRADPSASPAAHRPPLPRANARRP